MRALAVGLAAALSGCGTPPVPPDVLVVGQTGEPRTLDPHAATSANDFRILANLYEGLVRFKPGTLDVEPALAESWTASKDGRIYDFRLRPGVRFHDGAPLDAEAVRFNFERMLDPRHPYHHTGPFPLAFFFSAVEKVEVRDARTVRFRLREPFAPLLSNLAYPTGWIVSPAAVRRWGEDFGRNPVGTGPFRFAGWTTHSKVTLERSPGYWGRPAEAKALVFRPIPDAVSRVLELRSGGIDVLLEAPPDDVAALRGDTRFQVSEETGPHLWFLILNVRRPPFSDVRVRRAVNYAVDKKGLVDGVLQGTASVAAGPIPEAFGWAHDPSVKPYPYDPERARALLRDAAWKDGGEVLLRVPQGGSGMLAPLAMAAAIQADLAAVGVKVRIESYEWNTYLGKVNGGLGDADMAAMAWMTNDPDTLPYLALRSAAAPEKGGFNSGYYGNPELDRLIEAARAETSRPARSRLYRRIHRLVHDDAPWLFVASWRQNAVARRGMEGLRLEPSFLLRLAEVRKR